MLFHKTIEICTWSDKMVFYPPEVKEWIFLSCFHGDMFFLSSTVYCICCALAFIFSNLWRHLTPAFIVCESRSLAFSLMHCFVCGHFLYLFLYCLSSLHDVKARGRTNPSIILCLHHTLCVHIKEGLQVTSPLERGRAWRGTQQSSIFWIWRDLLSRTHISFGYQQETQTASNPLTF